jgi:general secretion pathway protein G
MQRASYDKRIFFPWERRGSFVRRLGLARVWPFVGVGVLLALVLAIAVRERRATGIRRTRAILVGLGDAVDRYRAGHSGQCPRKFSELEPYRRERGAPLDAWGNVVRLTCPSPRGDFPYRLSSDGPDGVPGGLDRIEN